MVEAFNLAFDLNEEEGESQNKQLNQRLVSRDEEIQVQDFKSSNKEVKICIIICIQYINIYTFYGEVHEHKNSFDSSDECSEAVLQRKQWRGHHSSQAKNKY